MMKVKECEWYGDCEVFAQFAEDVCFAFTDEKLQAVADEWEVDVDSIDVDECEEFMHGWDD